MHRLNLWFTAWLHRKALTRYRRVFKMPNYKSPLSVVTEHAIVRYMERIKGQDIEALKESILSRELKTLIATYGGEGKFIVDGVGYSVKNGRVLSVYKPASPLTPTIKPMDGQDIARRWSF